MKMNIEFTLNGESRQCAVEPNLSLADALRYQFGLKSLKCGCDKGDCGTCTILINGKAVRSCLILAVEAAGQKVTTLEGLMPNGELMPLQKKLIEHNSFQCGFCAPGIIMSLSELLAANPSPNEAEVKESIAGNLCRCTGYMPIIEAVMDLVKSQREKKA
jgi:carbon-monoxide dehydrogenase small subunit